jgi:hypothetical protein
MNWAWGLRLKPTLKFVLMALADAADDGGYCWPSIPTLAFKTCLDDRSVQRILNRLKADQLVQVEKRFRNDGSPTSNGYRLALKNAGGVLSPPPPAHNQEVVTPLSPRGGSSVTQTTTEHVIESKIPLPYVDNVDEGCRGLIFPKQLTAREVSLAQKKLGPFAPALAQELLDELSARLNACTVRSSPLAYLRSLTERAEAGTFSPEAGVRVALGRQRDQELAALAQSRPPMAVPKITSNPREHIDRLRMALTNKINVNQE